MRCLPDNNLQYPVLIEHDNGSGSGFYYRTDKKIFLVTAEHVIYSQDEPKKLLSNKLKLTSYDTDTSVGAIILEVDLTKATLRKKDNIDVALIEIANYNNGDSVITHSNGVKQPSKTRSSIVVVPPSSLKKFDEVLISNDVFILGYPSSLGIEPDDQIEHDKPLLRKGIVAGLNTKNKTIILDCPVYFGNSGGMAIQVEEIALGEKRYSVIGVVSQYIPFVEKLRSIQHGYVNSSIENSGYSVAVPMDTIFELTSESPE